MKKYLLLLFVGVCSLLVFNACSGDDDVDPKSPEGIKRALVGAWSTTMKSSNWKTIYIRPNGVLMYDSYSIDYYRKYNYKWDNNKGVYVYTGKETDEYKATFAPGDSAHWTFNEQDNSIYMYRGDGYYKYTYKVVMSDDQQSWVGTDANGQFYTFTKINE